MSADLSAILEALRNDPQQREEFRRVVFGDQPDLRVALAELAEAQRRTEVGLTALTARVDQLAEAQRRTEVALTALTARVDQLTARVDQLAARVDQLAGDLRDLTMAQRATEDSLKSLIDVVRGMNDRLGKLDGHDLERRYREKGQAYLSRIAGRLRVLDGNVLSPLVDDAEHAGKLTELEAQSVFLADAIFSGRDRDSREPVHLVVEASVTVDRSDVRRARERAELFARVIDTPVIAVVAGELVPEPVAEAAQDAGVWYVSNGRSVSPDDDRDARE